MSWRSDPSLTYEWSNYRFASAWLNSTKQNADAEVLDPFEVEDGWFELHLPSLGLLVAPRIPDEVRKKAEFTLQRLRLRDDERVVRQRRAWYQEYQAGNLPLVLLAKLAPLVARAVAKQEARPELPAADPGPSGSPD